MCCGEGIKLFTSSVMGAVWIEEESHETKVQFRPLQDQDHEQDQDFSMKFIGKSYSLYDKDIHQIWCRSAKFLWKSKFCSESWYYFGFQYQNYISYIEDTHQILFGSANSFASYCVHMKNPRTYVHPDIQTELS